MQLTVWMVVRFGFLEFGLNFQRLIEEVEKEEDLETGDTMIQKQNVLIVMDMVIGHVLVQRRETKENVTIAVNLDIKQENVLRKEEEVMTMVAVDLEAEVEAEVEVEVEASVEASVEAEEVAVVVTVGVHFEMEISGKEGEAKVEARARARVEAKVEARAHVREVIANSNNLSLHFFMPLFCLRPKDLNQFFLSFFSPLSYVFFPCSVFISFFCFHFFHFLFFIFSYVFFSP